MRGGERAKEKERREGYLEIRKRHPMRSLHWTSPVTFITEAGGNVEAKIYAVRNIAN